MAPLWDWLRKYFPAPDLEPPQRRESAGADYPSTRAESTASDGYPNTFPRDLAGAPDVPRARVFDPALMHFPHGFRLADPVIADPTVARQWRHARSQVLDHLLRIAAASPWKDHLVLRGSLLLKAWLGDVAREPGDIDWVVRPTGLKMTARAARSMLDGLMQLVSSQPAAGEAFIDTTGIAIDDIWTYDRAPGRRISFPWSSPGLPSGVAEMDFVFEEPLFAPPVPTPVPTLGGDSILVQAATKEVSLAWKLLWLETDGDPQGKDLYDATLLAERTRLPLRLLEAVMRSGDYPPARPLEPDFPLEWQVNWDNFRLEYPDVEGEARDWQVRLTAALALTFAEG